MPPLYNPVDLAQSTALIDVLSRGRLILGVGVGYHPRYFLAFGVRLSSAKGDLKNHLKFCKRPGPRRDRSRITGSIMITTRFI